MASPALILIHGYPFDHTLWNYVVEPLRKVTTVITPDLPGFGRTPVPPSEASIDRMADEIAKVFVNEHLDHAVVAGMSMGGYVALSLAERYRHRLAGLGLISTQCVADTDEARRARLEMVEQVRASGPAMAAEAAIQKLFAKGKPVPPEMHRYVQIGAERAGTEGIAWALQAMAARPDRSGMLKAFHIPSLVVHGELDQFIPKERAREMADLMPDCEYSEIPGAGHALPLEAPDQLVEELLGLLDRAEAAEPHLEGQLNRPGVVISPTDQGL